MTFESNGVKQPARGLEFRADNPLAPLVARMRLAMHVFQEADALKKSRALAFKAWAVPVIGDESKNATDRTLSEWQARFVAWRIAWHHAVHVELEPPKVSKPKPPPSPPVPPSPFYRFSGSTPVPEPEPQTRMEKRLHHSLTTLLQGLTLPEKAAMRYEHGRNRRYATKPALSDADDEEENERVIKEAARGACDPSEYEAAVQNIRRAQLEAEYEDSTIKSSNGTTTYTYLTTPIVSWLQIEDLYLQAIRPRHPWASFLNWFFTSYDDDNEYELEAKGVFSPPNYIFVRPLRDYSFQLLLAATRTLPTSSSSSSNPLLVVLPPPPPFVRVQERGQEDVDYFIYGDAPIPGLPGFITMEGYDKLQMDLLKRRVEGIEEKRQMQTKKRPASSSASANDHNNNHGAVAALLLPTHKHPSSHSHQHHHHAKEQQQPPEDDRRASLSSSAAKKSSRAGSAPPPPTTKITNNALLMRLLRDLPQVITTTTTPRPKGLGKSPHNQRKT